jgi:hypothetical protein
VIAGGFAISYIGNEFNINENILIVVASIGAVIALGVAIFYFWSCMQDLKTFSITSDSTGLTLQDGKKNVRIAWGEVVSFQADKVTGSRGGIIELPDALVDRKGLKKVIEEDAAPSITRHLRDQFNQQGKVTLGIMDITQKGLAINRTDKEGAPLKTSFTPWENIARLVVDRQDRTVQWIEWPGLQPHRIGSFSEIHYSYALEDLSRGLIPPRVIDPDPIDRPPVSRVIFISYRRSDSIEYVGRIYDRLEKEFHKGSVFMDVNSMLPGLNFKERLDKELEECSVLLAIIGRKWLKVKGATGNRRLDEPDDYVRMEIESALERKIPVIPVLVGGASMPSREALPESLENFVYQNGIAIRPDPDFARDMDTLIKSIRQYLKTVPMPPL